MQIQKVIVFGAGTMGSGIAQWLAQQEVDVELVDQSEEQAQAAVQRIQLSWDKLQKKGKFSAEQIQRFKSQLIAQTRQNIDVQAELVIEAIFEDLEAKKELFNELDQRMSPTSLLASNTSSFCMASMAKELSKSRQQKFIGLHFFNPAPIMRLVEIIRSPWTPLKLAQDLGQWFEKRGKKIAQVSDAPGFIVNRVARNFYGEALRIAESRDESCFKEIDSIMREVAGFRMGPFELMDLIGIDVNYHVTQSVWKAYFHEPRFAPHPIQRQMVDSGRLGRKTGEGFYSYET